MYWSTNQIMIRVIIAGGRDFNNYALLEEKCDFYLKNQNKIEIVCGLAKGADLLGKRYGRERGYLVTDFPADWNKNGKGAGPIRNQQMADYATHLIAFWDQKSRGTKDMIDRATDKGLTVRVVRY